VKFIGNASCRRTRTGVGRRCLTEWPYEIALQTLLWYSLRCCNRMRISVRWLGGFLVVCEEAANTWEEEVCWQIIHELVGRNGIQMKYTVNNTCTYTYVHLYIYIYIYNHNNNNILRHLFNCLISLLIITRYALRCSYSRSTAVNSLTSVSYWRGYIALKMKSDRAVQWHFIDWLSNRHSAESCFY